MSERRESLGSAGGFLLLSTIISILGPGPVSILHQIRSFDASLPFEGGAVSPRGPEGPWESDIKGTEVLRRDHGIPAPTIQPRNFMSTQSGRSK
ncbi:hypothetical protein QBC47DRAFT_407453 [Echria macrotheca]|uniref:Uncharacterized protein n=1 Tax=Echria macrotheca TaxID=438768 RepID=A0AAJ0B2F3_9PEZI|nr:hypothetical protein QBC47DRAFT_407453 [Echria macrotheca]